MGGNSGFVLPGLARMAQVTRAISEAQARPLEPTSKDLILLTPWTLRGPEPVELPNRVVFPPIPTGLDGVRQVRWYRARAVGGVGLVIVDATACRTPKREELRETFEAISAAGSVAGGAIAVERQGDFGAISSAELKGLCLDVSERAKALVACGARVVHLSIANDDLLDRSVRRSTNRRTDRFGRGPQGRYRFAQSIIDGLRRVGVPVIARIAVGAPATTGLGVDQLIALGHALAEAGVAALEVVFGPRWDEPTAPLTAGVGEATSTTLSGRLARVVAVPVIASGRVLTAAGAESVLREGNATAVSVGRALVADPAWVAKARAGLDAEVVPCIGCLACYGRAESTPIACLVNGDVGGNMQMVPAVAPKRIVVRGAGLPALEFSRIAASRGHEVTVVPGVKPLGGISGLRASIPGNAEYGRAILYLVDRLRELGVMFGQPPAPADLEVATENGIEEVVSWGSGRNCLLAGDVLGRDLHQMYGIGRRVAICGDGILAAEVALFLAGWGRRPTLIVPGSGEMMFPEAHAMQTAVVRERLAGYKVDIVTGVRPVQWHDTSDRKCRLTVRDANGNDRDLGPFQTVVAAQGWQTPETGIGDSHRVRDLMALMTEAHRLGHLA